MTPKWTAWDVAEFSLRLLAYSLVWVLMLPVTIAYSAMEVSLDAMDDHLIAKAKRMTHGSRP